MARNNKNTRTVQVGGTTFFGKSAKKALRLLRSYNHWTSVFEPAQSRRGACPRQRPGSLKH